MLFIASRNTASQDLAIGGIVNLGTTYRTSYRRCNGVRTFENTGTSILTNQAGIYSVLVTATVSAPAAGDVVLQLQSNGVTIPSAIATETISTAATEFRTVTIQAHVLVNETNVLNTTSIVSQALTLVNTGVASTITNLAITVTKEV